MTDDDVTTVTSDPDVNRMPLQQPSALTAKLAAVMAALERVPKRGHHDYQDYDYATEADVAAAVRPLLAQAQIMVYPTMLDKTSVALPTRDGKAPQYLTTVRMRFDVVDGESGETRSAEWFGEGQDAGDKGLYKAITGAEKYFLLKTFLMPTGDDPEVAREDEKPSIDVSTPDVSVGKPSPPPDDERRLTVTDVEKHEGTTKAGKHWTKWRVTFSDGSRAATFDGGLADLAVHALDNTTPVWVGVTPAANPKWDPTLEAIRLAAADLTADRIPF